MNTILAILFILAVLALGLWIAWNVLEVLYRVVMITLCAIGYAILTVWEVITSVINFLIVKPVTGILKLVRH